MFDGATFTQKFTGQQLAPSALPEFVRDPLKEEVEFDYGVAQLEHMVEAADGGVIRLRPPMMADLVRLLNNDVVSGRVIHSL